MRSISICFLKRGKSGFRLKGSVTLLLVLCLLLSNSISSSAAVQIPEKVRIGIYFEGTALSSFTIGADTGLEVGYFKDNSFTALFNETSGNALTVRKDAYFANANGKLTYYNTTDKTIPAGEKIGPFHIQVGNGYSDASMADTVVRELETRGVQACLAYNDSWQVWTGFYTDQISAQTDLTSRVQAAIPGGIFNIVQPASNRIVISRQDGRTALIFAGSVSQLQIHPVTGDKPYVFKLNNNKDLLFRGDLEVRRITGSDMTLINILPIEQYLYGVVPAEIGSTANPEALKAQAVAARTYTLNALNKHSKYGFDLCTTTSCQVYKGYDGECASTNKAVDDTQGKKVTYNGKLAEVFYSSSSGGITEDVKNVWGSNIPYLVSVEDKYESGKTYNYNWLKIKSASDIQSTLKARGYDLGDILSVCVTKTASSGRAIELTVKGTKGQRVYTLDGCRTAFGLESQWYAITTDSDIIIRNSGSNEVKTQMGAVKVMTTKGLKDLRVAKGSKITVVGAGGRKDTVPVMPEQYTFTGKGWGHAVGMSQDGAMGMAKAGFKYEEIIAHYFPGTRVE